MVCEDFGYEATLPSPCTQFVKNAISSGPAGDQDDSVVLYDFVYLAHPMPVTSLSWREKSHLLPGYHFMLTPPVVVLFITNLHFILPNFSAKTSCFKGTFTSELKF